MTINPIVIGVIIDQLSYVGGLTLYNMYNMYNWTLEVKII